MTDIRDEVAEMLRRCMGLDPDDNARHDFGGSLQRPTEVAAGLVRALAARGLTVVREGELTPEGTREFVAFAVEYLALHLGEDSDTIKVGRRIIERLARQPEGQ